MLEDLMLKNPKRVRSNQIHTSNPLTTQYSLVVLSVFSIFFGFFAHDFILASLEASFQNQQTLSAVSAVDGTNFVRTKGNGSAVLSLPLYIELLPTLLAVTLLAVPALIKDLLV